MLSLSEGGCISSGVSSVSEVVRDTWGEKGADSVLPYEFLNHEINFAGANFKCHSRTLFSSICSNIIVLKTLELE